MFAKGVWALPIHHIREEKGELVPCVLLEDPTCCCLPGQKRKARFEINAMVPSSPFVVSGTLQYTRPGQKSET